MKYLITILFLLLSSLVLAQDVNMQTATVNQCGGIFYDSGGEFGNYGNGEDFILTICPENPNQKIQIEFTTFITQLNEDVMAIFNGDSTAEPLFGNFSGNTSPGLVQATQDNASGCITIQFTSSPAASLEGWVANITCLTPCQTINSQIDSSSPVPNEDGYIRVCPNEDITLNGSGVFSVDGAGATYDWDLGDGNTASGQTVTVSYLDPGVYIVNLNIRDANTSNDPLGCENNNLINQVIQVATEPVFTGTEAANTTLCFGESTDIIGEVEAVEFINDCTPPVSGITFLPDGNGVTYETSITVDCYESEQNLTDISQLISICLTMEHSYLGDLDIEIISPNGQVVRMHDQGGGSANLGIPWATGTVDGNSNNTTPGVGSQYCFVTIGGFPTLVGGIEMGGDFPDGNGPGTYSDSFVPAGNYSSVNPLNGLVGSPLNGDWTIRVVDNIGADNGHIFAWGIEFDPNLQPPELSFTPIIASEAWDADPTITNTAGNVITVTPPDAGQYCYTYRVTDDFGCEYTEEVCIDVLPEIVTETPNNLFICDTGIPPYIFDLESNTAVVLASAANTADLVVTYHNSLADADGDIGAITDLGSYSGTDNETIFVRVEYLNSECYEVLPFTLNVSGQPEINSVLDLELCDDDSNDGFEEFDLATQTAGILGSQSATDFNVTYHLSFLEADSGTGALPNLYTNGINPEPIFVRIESVGDSDCYNASGTAVFNLIVNPADDASFTVTPTCVGVITLVTGLAGGTFTFDPAPTDGAIIDATTGLVTGGTAGTTYTITYTTAGICSSTSSQTFNVLELDDASFTVAPTCDGGIVDVTGVPGGTFSFNPVPTDTAVIDAATGNVTNGTAGGTYTIEYVTAETCSNTATVQFTANPLPVVIDPTPLEVCDDGVPDGLTEMDLSIKNPEITDNNSSYAVSYYETLADAQSGTIALPTLYTNTSNGQIIFVRVEDTVTGCYDTTTLELFVQQAPVANIPTPLRYCDPDNDGFGIFTLTDADTEITAGVAGLTVSYHETEANANNNADAIDTTVDYNNIVVNMQTLYVRVESPTIATNCATIVALELIVEPSPQLVDPTTLEVCDDISADGFAVFDLTTASDEVLNGQNPAQYIVSYYQSESDAESATSPIANPLAYTNTEAFTQVIWLRVEDSATVEGCYKLTSLTLIVNPLPVLVSPSPLELCDVNGFGDEQEAFMLEDANAEILNGQTGISITYYQSEVDADTATSAIASPYTNTSNAQTVYVRAENDVTGCYSTITLTLRVNPIPSPEPEPEPIEVCDEDNDGFGEFNLELRTVELTNGEPDVVITYHETQEEAEQGISAITGLYTNIVANSQMIYVRSENTITGCYSLTLNTLELIVVASPEVPIDLEPLVLCDDDNNGITQFDLTTMDANILGTQNPLEVILTYHTSAADAQTGNNPIINTTNYSNTINPQTIYVRLFNPGTDCLDTGVFELQVELPPEAVAPIPLELCDDLGESPGDEMTVFDLTVKDAEITSGEASWSVSYYETDADAQTQMNAIPDPTQYTNTSVNGLPQNPQTLYVVVTDTDTGCVDYTTMTIRVLPNPTPTPSAEIPALELCDEINTGDGVEVFNLLGLENDNAQEDLILNGEAAVTASYHETIEDADSGLNPILDPSNYTNIESPEQVVYVRVTSNSTGCYTVVNFTIRVNPLPEVVAVTDFIQCELNTDGFDSFDLRTKDAEVLNGQDATQFIVTYHENIADAEAEMNALISPYINITNPQEIFVTITNSDTGCSISTQRFNIQVDEAAQANADMSAIVYEECDDNMEIDGNPSNDSVQFDLSTQDLEVLDGQDPANYIVTYYTTEEDANLNVNPLPNLYENIVNPQVIYARVDNNTLSVQAIALDVSALTTGLDLDADGTIDTYDTDADGVFDLIDVDGDGLSDAIDSNADGIAEFIDIDGDGQGDPVDLNNDGTFDNQVDGSICFAVAPLTLQVNPLPEFDLDESYILCVNTNGTEILSTPILDTELLATAYSFEWSYNGNILPTETGPSLEPTQGGTYSVIVIDISTSSVTSCINMDSAEVIESEPPLLEVNMLTEAFVENNVIEAIATGMGDYEYSLDGGPWQDSGVFTNVSQGTRVVTARDKIGCGFTTKQQIVIDYPLYFTPNGDGNNDTWNIVGIGSNTKIYIFDRYGKLLKQLSPSGSGWNGTYNGNMMPTSDYWFTVVYDEPLTGDPKEFKAHFTLKR
jgi:gliding motility-associated-like protein